MKAKRARVDDRDRMRLVELVFDQGFEPKRAAATLGIKLRTAYGVLQVFEKEKRVKAKKKGGRVSVFSEPFKDNVVDFFTKIHPDGTLRECQAYIEANPHKFGVRVPSQTTINRICKERRISMKIVSIVPKSRNNPKTIELRFEYVCELQRALDRELELIYIDEMGCNLHTRRRFARSKVGEAATISVPTQRGNNLSTCAAISMNGLVHQRSKFLAYNQDEFVIFLDEMYEKLSESKKYVAIMDNVRFHKTERVREWFDSKPNIHVLYLPPYSPMLNAIEEANAKVHMRICSARPSQQNRLLSCVKEAWQSITASDCAGYIRHTRRFHRQCYEKLPILNEADPNCSQFDVLSDGELDESDLDEIAQLEID